MQFDSGFLSPYFINNGPTMIASWTMPTSASRKEVSNLRDRLPDLEQVSPKEKKRNRASRY